MRCVIALAMLVALLQGCATRLELLEPGAGGGLRFQTNVGYLRYEPTVLAELAQ